jgi:hypothetical protein
LGFQDRCLKPLGHPSKPIESSSYLGDARGRRWPLLPLCQPTLLVGLFMAACSASSTCAGASAAFRVVHPRLADRGVMDEPRRLPLRHKRRSTSCSQTAPVEPATTSARWLDVLKHKPLPTRGVTTAVWNPHQAGPLRPACCSWKGAVGQPATVFPANRRNRSWAPVLRRRKHLCRPSVKKIAGRETRDASWTVPKLHLQFC